MGSVPLLALLTVLLVGATSNTAPPAPTRAVVFVCEHGSAKSVVAAAHFNRIAAERGLDVRAVTRGTSPDSALAPPAVKGLEADGLVPTVSLPQKLERADLESAIAVIAFNDLPAELAAGIDVQRWEVPPISTDYSASRDAIVAHIEQLIPSLVGSSKQAKD